MPDYIDREAANLALAEQGFDWDKAKQALASVPAADVAPVRHGRWEVVVGSDGKEHMVCTVCRKQQGLTGVFSYCPNCGAKMDGGEDNG